jgi:hypothetical protein
MHIMRPQYNLSGVLVGGVCHVSDSEVECTAAQTMRLPPIQSMCILYYI